MAFKPGQSGNPAGPNSGNSPKFFAKSLAMDALKTLQAIHTDSNAPAEARLDAAKSILLFSGKTAQPL